jgi:mannose-6-phosphate isomerase-like protein (cupin superfamily)
MKPAGEAIKWRQFGRPRNRGDDDRGGGRKPFGDLDGDDTAQGKSDQDKGLCGVDGGGEAACIVGKRFVFMAGDPIDIMGGEAWGKEDIFEDPAVGTDAGDKVDVHEDGFLSRAISVYLFDYALLVGFISNKISTCMNIDALTILDIHQQTEAVKNPYANFPLTRVNDHVIRVAIMTEPFYWHAHPNSDESFLVIEGSIFIDLEDKTIELFPGHFFTIPKNIKHRTRPNGKRSVNLTFEYENMETIKLD